MQREAADLFQHAFKEHHFSGAGLIKKGEQTLFAGACGLAHRGFDVPNRMDTRFDTASITKLFTAVAVLQLADQGKLSLDDRITEIIDLSGTAIPQDVTLTHLLTHTSGIADDADEELGESYEALFLDKPNYSIRNNKDFLPQFAYKQPKFKAGTAISYNNCAFVLLGLGIEQAAGETYRDYVAKHVFERCGMEHTSFAAKDDGDAPIAEGYELIKEGGGETIWRKNIYAYPPIGTADGGAFTTVGDLHAFMMALSRGKLLSEAMTNEIMKPQTTLERSYDWGKMINGFGFHFCYNHNGKLLRMFKDGCNAGVAANMAYYPASNVTISILANQTCNVWELHRKAEQLVAEHIQLY
ncbi:serine hydrolase domain-containing protein [Paenibacillus sp. CAU 1782]